jgi:putative inorganic carbon (hco3(-)) transporter
VLFVPLQIALLARGATRWLAAHVCAPAHSRSVTAIEVALLILTAGTLLLTQSRGAWVGMIVSALAFLAWHSRTTRAVAALSTVAGIALAIKIGPARLVNLTISQSGPGMAGDVSGRMEIWSRALYGIQDFPITGMGMNTFRKVMPVLYPTLLTSPDFDVAHAHNHLLQAALDLGVPGLDAYAAVWMITASVLVSVCRRSTERAYRAMAAGLGAGLIAQFTFGMTDAIPLGAKVGVLFWLTVAVAVALHRVALGPPLKA